MKGLDRRLVALFMALLWSTGGYAGEAFITKARGTNLTIDQGAEAGLVVGMEVAVVRPPGEAVIHPVTGENLGSPEIEIAVGQITKTSARAASVTLGRRPLLSVQPGDLVRFITPEEEMIMDQERSMATAEKAQEERRTLKGSVSDLTRSIRKTQGTIGDLRGAINRLERIDESIKVQLRGINEDIHVMKEEISSLKESVSLMGAVPISGGGEDAGTWIEDEENKQILEGIIREVIQEEQPEPAVMVTEAEEPIEEVDDFEDIEEVAEEEEEDDEEEDFEVEEEDDIVVEETA